MIRTVLLIPIRDNQGRSFLRTDWLALQNRLLPFGGFTRWPDVTGVWQAGGRTYRDRSRQYVVALSSWRQLPAWLDVVEWARVRFRQVALYIEVAGVPEILGQDDQPAGAPRVPDS